MSRSSWVIGSRWALGAATAWTLAAGVGCQPVTDQGMMVQPAPGVIATATPSAVSSPSPTSPALPMPPGGPVPPPFIPVPSEPYSTAPSVFPTPQPQPMAPIVPDPASAQPYPVSGAVAPLPQGYFRVPTWLERPDGDLLGVWMDDGQRGHNPPASPGLYGVRVKSADWTAGTPVMLTSDAGMGLQTAWNPASQTFWLTWSVYRGNYKSDVLLAQVTPDGVLKGSVQTVTGDGSQPQLAVAAGTGTVAVAWTDGRQSTPSAKSTDVYARLYTTDGTASGNEVPICTEPRSQTVASVLPTPTGEFGVVWCGGSPGGIYVQRVSASASLLGEPVAIALGQGADGQGIVATTDARTHEHFLAWPSTQFIGPAYGLTIQGQRLTADVQPMGGPVAVAAGDGVNPPSAIVTDPATGMHVIVWETVHTVVDSVWHEPSSFGGDLVIQRVGPEGRPIGTPVTLVKDEADHRFTYDHPLSLLWLTTGQVLASWSQASDARIRVQPFVIPR